MTRPLEAVLFDMDGTIVDTEKLWDIALRELATHYGGVLSDAARAAMIGSSAVQTVRLLGDDLDLPDLDIEDGTDRLTARMKELYAERVPWRPGAAELIASVRAAGIATALVTNTGRSLVEIALRTMGETLFDVVVCGDDVAFTKPHPEPYLAAARALRVEPDRCVVIEDSPTGLASARAAGCALLAIPNEIPLLGADIAGASVRASLLEVDLPLLRHLVA